MIRLDKYNEKRKWWKPNMKVITFKSGIDNILA